MNTIFLLLFPALMAFTAFSDLFTMRISNRLVLATAAAFPILALIAGLPLEAIGMHAAAGTLVLAVTFAMFAAGWIGGGDAKIAAAIAMWMGFGLVLPFLLYAAILGGVLTLGILIARRYMLPAPLLNVGWIERLHDRATGIPYGIALAVAALLIYPQTAVFQGLA